MQTEFARRVEQHQEARWFAQDVCEAALELDRPDWTAIVAGRQAAANGAAEDALADAVVARFGRYHGDLLRSIDAATEQAVKDWTRENHCWLDGFPAAEAALSLAIFEALADRRGPFTALFVGTPVAAALAKAVRR
jgi:hypothetical protein